MNDSPNVTAVVVGLTQWHSKASPFDPSAGKSSAGSSITSGGSLQLLLSATRIEASVTQDAAARLNGLLGDNRRQMLSLLDGEAVGELVHVPIRGGNVELITWSLPGDAEDTAALMRAVPVPDPRVHSAGGVLSGEVPSPANPPSGCYFHPRCPYAFDRCRELPPLAPRLPEAPGHLDRCWLEPSVKRARRETGGRIGLTEGAAS